MAVALPLIFAVSPSLATPAEHAPKPPVALEAEAQPVASSASLDTFSPQPPAVENGRSSEISLTAVKNKPWERIDFNTRRCTNNTWGAPKEETLASSVYLNSDGSFGHYWNRPAPLKSGLTVQPLYPNVRIGGSPWEASNSASFPIRLKDTKSLKLSVEYRYLAIPTGTYNLAYDMFFLDTNQPSPKPRIKAEVMIWLHGTHQQPSITYKGDFTDGNNTYQLYSWVKPGGDGLLLLSYEGGTPVRSLSYSGCQKADR